MLLLCYSFFQGLSAELVDHEHLPVPSTPQTVNARRHQRNLSTDEPPAPVTLSIQICSDTDDIPQPVNSTERTEIHLDEKKDDSSHISQSCHKEDDKEMLILSNEIEEQTHL